MPGVQRQPDAWTTLLSTVQPLGCVSINLNTMYILRKKLYPIGLWFVNMLLCIPFYVYTHSYGAMVIEEKGHPLEREYIGGFPGKVAEID